MKSSKFSRLSCIAFRMEVDTQPQAQITKAEKKSSERQKVVFNSLISIDEVLFRNFLLSTQRIRENMLRKSRSYENRASINSNQLFLEFDENTCFRKKVEPGVLYVGHLPAQFSEPSLRKYFEQFGRIIRLRLSRSKKVRIEF